MDINPEILSGDIDINRRRRGDTRGRRLSVSAVTRRAASGGARVVVVVVVLVLAAAAAVHRVLARRASSCASASASSFLRATCRTSCGGARPSALALQLGLEIRAGRGRARPPPGARGPRPGGPDLLGREAGRGVLVEGRGGARAAESAVICEALRRRAAPAPFKLPRGPRTGPDQRRRGSADQRRAAEPGQKRRESGGAPLGKIPSRPWGRMPVSGDSKSLGALS